MILAHLRGLVRPYYTQGARSVLAENLTLQAISFERQAEYYKTKILSDTAILALMAPKDMPNMQESIFKKFDALRGLLFNQRFDVARAEKRVEFEEIAKKMLSEGKIGRNPKLRPDLKITQEEANTRKAKGEEIPEWYIRTEEDEAIVIKMIEEWKNKNNIQ